MTMTTLQNPVKACMESITDDLKNVTKAQRGFAKILDRVRPKGNRSYNTMLTDTIGITPSRIAHGSRRHGRPSDSN